MEYGTAPEDRSVALQWIANHGGLIGPYVNGAFAPARDDLTIRNPATGEKLAGMTLCTKDEVTEAVQSARAAQPDWQKAGGAARARVLYALARLMQKHARLLAVMESLDNGKPIRESRDIDIPLAIRHFYHHAGHAQLMPSALSDRVALGVCGQIIPWNFPLLMLAWKIAPALAMGNTVVLKPAEYTPMTAMIFADICSQAGVPPGVVNIVTGDGSTGRCLNPRCRPAARNMVHLAHKVCGKERRRFAVDPCRGALIFDPSFIHHHDSIGNRHRLFLIVGDMDKGCPNLALYRLQFVLHGTAKL